MVNGSEFLYLSLRYYFVEITRDCTCLVVVSSHAAVDAHWRSHVFSCNDGMHQVVLPGVHGHAHMLQDYNAGQSIFTHLSLWCLLITDCIRVITCSCFHVKSFQWPATYAGSTSCQTQLSICRGNTFSHWAF